MVARFYSTHLLLIRILVALHLYTYRTVGVVDGFIHSVWVSILGTLNRGRLVVTMSDNLL